MSQLKLSSSLPARQSGRFLIAEDDALMREVLVRVLTAEGNLVQAAGDGRQALGLYENDKFDLVILDYEMPDMSGDELAVIIKALAPTQPLMMITAYSEKLALNLLTDIEVIVQKPFEIAALREAIKRSLRQQRQAPADDIISLAR